MFALKPKIEEQRHSSFISPSLPSSGGAGRGTGHKQGGPGVLTNPIWDGTWEPVSQMGRVTHKRDSPAAEHFGLSGSSSDWSRQSGKPSHSHWALNKHLPSAQRNSSSLHKRYSVEKERERVWQEENLNVAKKLLLFQIGMHDISVTIIIEIKFKQEQEVTVRYKFTIVRYDITIKKDEKYSHWKTKTFCDKITMVCKLWLKKFTH